MARSRAGEKRRSGPGWFRIFFGLSFLAVAGFAVGMVAGVVWQDPGLAFAYLTGETEDVAWNGSGAAESRPQVAAAPAGSESPVDPQVRRRQAAEPQVPGTADVATAPAGRLAIQVGAFATSLAAEELAKSLRNKGYPVSVSPGAGAGESRWRVRVGPLATRSDAEATAARLKQQEKLPTWILNEDAG